MNLRGSQQADIATGSKKSSSKKKGSTAPGTIPKYTGSKGQFTRLTLETEQQEREPDEEVEEF